MHIYVDIYALMHRPKAVPWKLAWHRSTTVADVLATATYACFMFRSRLISFYSFIV